MRKFIVVFLSLVALLCVTSAFAVTHTYHEGEEDSIAFACRWWSGIDTIVISPGAYSASIPLYIDGGKLVIARGITWRYTEDYLDNAVTFLDNDNKVIGGHWLYGRSTFYVGGLRAVLDSVVSDSGWTGLWVGSDDPLTGSATAHNSVFNAIENSAVAGVNAEIALWDCDLRKSKGGFVGLQNSTDYLDGCLLGDGYGISVRLDGAKSVVLRHNKLDGDSVSILVRGGCDSLTVVNNILTNAALGFIYYQGSDTTGYLYIVNNVLDHFSYVIGGNAIWLEDYPRTTEITNNFIGNGRCGVGGLNPNTDTLGWYNVFYNCIDNTWNVILGNSGTAVNPATEMDSNYVPLPGSIYIHSGKPTILNPDGSRSHIGAYGGPWGIWNGFPGYPLRIKENVIQPEIFSLTTYPNPFNSSVTIEASQPNVEIFDILGQQVFCSEKSKVIWTPDQSVPSGIYFVRAHGNISDMQKISYTK